MGGETFLNNNWILLKFNKIFIKVYVRQVFINVWRNFISSGHYVQQVLKNYLEPCKNDYTFSQRADSLLWSNLYALLFIIKHVLLPANQSIKNYFQYAGISEQIKNSNEKAMLSRYYVILRPWHWQICATTLHTVPLTVRNCQFPFLIG